MIHLLPEFMVPFLCLDHRALGDSEDGYEAACSYKLS